MYKAANNLSTDGKQNKKQSQDYEHICGMGGEILSPVPSLFLFFSLLSLTFLSLLSLLRVHARTHTHTHTRTPVIQICQPENKKRKAEDDDTHIK